MDRKIIGAGAYYLSASSFFCLSFACLLILVATPVLADKPRPPARVLSPAEVKRKNDFIQKIGARSTKTITAVPSNLPAPLFPSAKFTSGVIITRLDGAKVTRLNYYSEKDDKEIFEWYERSLRGNGWKVRETETKSGHPEWVIGHKNAETFFNVHLKESYGGKKARKKGAPSKGCAFTIVINQTKPPQT